MDHEKKSDRLVVLLPESLKKRVKKEATKAGETLGEFIRRVLDEHFKAQK